MESIIKGTIALIIKGHGINVDELDKQLNMKHASYKQEGNDISKVLPSLESDIVKYAEEVDDISLDDKIHFFCKKISNNLKLIKKKYSCKLRIYLQSSEAQMYWKLSEKTILAIHECNVECEFSILSWGECNIEE